MKNLFQEMKLVNVSKFIKIKSLFQATFKLQ